MDNYAAGQCRYCGSKATEWHRKGCPQLSASPLPDVDRDVERFLPLGYVQRWFGIDAIETNVTGYHSF
jgi:hypothetical protein